LPSSGCSGSGLARTSAGAGDEAGKATSVGDVREESPSPSPSSTSVVRSSKRAEPGAGATSTRVGTGEGAGPTRAERNQPLGLISTLSRDSSFDPKLVGGLKGGLLLVSWRWYLEALSKSASSSTPGQGLSECDPDGTATRCHEIGLLFPRGEGVRKRPHSTTVVGSKDGSANARLRGELKTRERSREMALGSMASARR
jgi:hypothetical protein